MPESDDLQLKLKQCDPDVLSYVDALKKENAKLQRRIGSLEASSVSSDHRIDALLEEIEFHRNASKMTDEETVEALIPMMMQAFKDAGGVDAFCKKHNLVADPID